MEYKSKVMESRMLLAIDVGNSQLFAGVFVDGKLQYRFRKTTEKYASSDEYGLFLRQVLRENEIDPNDIDQIVMCSVVPNLMHSLSSACIKYFNIQPLLLQAGIKTGLKIQYRNPVEVGTDRIANSIAANHLFPDENIIIVSFGTATTICALSRDKAYLGGLIAPGLRLSMEALEQKTAKLPKVEIVAPSDIIGRSTEQSIQSGLYYSGLGMVKEVIEQVKKAYFYDEPIKVIGTGGFSRLYQNEAIFDILEPDLILIGLSRVVEMNC